MRAHTRTHTRTHTHTQTHTRRRIRFLTEEALEREIQWLEYFEHVGEDMSPRLLAVFAGGQEGSDGRIEAPSLLMEDVGEMLREENAPADWERQIGVSRFAQARICC